MASRDEIERFLEAYTTSWKKKSGERRDIFHRQGGLRHPGSSEPFNPDVQASPTDQLREIAPDLEVRLLYWAERGDILFAEWELTCTLAGRRLTLPGVNRFRLDGDKALDAVAFIDRMQLAEFAEPESLPMTMGSLFLKLATVERPFPS